MTRRSGQIFQREGAVQPLAIERRNGNEMGPANIRQRKKDEVRMEEK
jgi:hypothetical protein